jgi:ATP-dependent Clp protease ATP-binding subunit ClpX
MALFNQIFYLSLVFTFVPFLTSCAVWYIYLRFVEKIKPIKGEYRKIGHGSKLKRIFIDFPRQLMRDKLTFDPDAFREFGTYVVCGTKGKGKTITVVYLLQWFKKMYPKLKVKTNFGYLFEDAPILTYQDVMTGGNGIYGEINVIDEIQNWFCSMQSKDFPPEMLSEIAHERKERKVIIGTTQVFGRVAKPIREQADLIFMPFTFCGCLTVVLKFVPLLKSNDATVEKMKFRGCFFFVHTPELRESYDTYRKIERMSKEGFKPMEQQLRSGSNINMNISSSKRFSVK